MEGPPLTAGPPFLHPPLPEGWERETLPALKKASFIFTHQLSSPVPRWQRQKAQGPARRKCGAFQVLIRPRVLYEGTSNTTAQRAGDATAPEALPAAA